MKLYKVKLAIAASLLATIIGLNAHAENPLTPESLSGVKIVSVDEVKELQTAGSKIIDARPAMEYMVAHIKGSENLPYGDNSEKTSEYDSSKDTFDLSKLPQDKATSIVFYCNGVKCWQSYKASKKAAAEGYTNVYWFRDGLPAWKNKSYPIE